MLFNSQTGREYAFRSLEARRRNKIRRKLEEEAEFKARIIEDHLAKETPLESLQADESSLKRRLSCVRQQLDNLHKMIDTETDAHKLDRLASAIIKLSELERVLSGRPLPGSHRPTTPTRRRSHALSIVPE